ncbi:MAG TPA: transglycosylase domain-containing protein [Anaerolineales bacterium]
MPERASFVLSRRHRRQDRRASRRQWRMMGGVGLGIVVAIVLAVLILLGALAYADLTRDLPNIAILPALLNPPDGLLLQPTRIYDRTGQNLLFTFDSASSGAGTAEPSFRRYIPLSPAAPQHLPDFLARATVIMADPGFWSGGGYTLAGLTDPDAHPTIAQKLVSDLLLYSEQPSLRRALRERILAAQLIAEYGHSQVLEWYLNSADYGHYAFGVEAAAELYYAVPATDLTPAQSAVLAATSQTPDLNPLDAPDMALERGRAAIQLMEQYSLVNGADAKSALASQPVPVSQNGSAANPRSAIVAGPFVPLVLHQLDSQFTRERIVRGGLSITTTMDFDLQQAVSCATSGIAAPGSSDCSASPPPSSNNNPRASLVLDPQTGQVLAADGSGVNSAAFTASHDPGTMLAPFVYLTAFTRGFGPGSLVWDIPFSPSTAAGQSTTTAPVLAAASGRQTAVYHGPVRMRIALANDYLGAEQRLAAEMGSDAISRTEASFGLPSGDSLLASASSLQSSAALQPTLLDVASAYGVFAANGVRYGLPGPTAVLRVDGLDHSVWLDLSNPQAQPVVTPALAYLMNSVLSDESARWPTLGHPNNLELDRPVGIKLGESADGSGSWGIGYTPSRLVAVWLGSQFPAAGQVQQPSTPAAASPTADSQRLLSSLLPLATRGQAANGWAAPPDVTNVDVCDPSGLLPTRDCPNTVTEVFLSGNEPVQTDTLFRTYTINRETGLLATVFTPPDLVEDKVFMIVPPEAQDWARTANIPVAPESYDAIQAPPINPDAHIRAPAMFSNVSGKVSFRGTASGANFDHYRLLVGQGLNPQSWTQVGADSTTRIEDGLLGTWDTTGLSGLYAVELQVIRTDQTIDTAITQVQVTAK